jgi:signal transduction histidine kinase
MGAMRVSIKTKQIAGVTTIVGLVALVLGAVHLVSVAEVRLQETRARGDVLAKAIYQRAREVVTSDNPSAALREDTGLRATLESSYYANSVTYAAIVDVRGVAIAHSDAASEGHPLPAAGDLTALLDESAIAQLRAIYAGDGRTFEVREPLLLDGKDFGSIRVGMSTLLVRDDVTKALRTARYVVLAALAAGVIAAIVLAQVLLRPIHLIRSGLTRLGQGEVGVRLDLPGRDEFTDLGDSFNAISARLSADRAQLSGDPAALASVVDHVESTLKYSRKLAALGRLSAGIAHEVKNPLNATMIHLELLKMRLSDPDALGHVATIAAEIRRLDEVVQGFLRFTRPEDLKLQPIAIGSLIDEIRSTLDAEAQTHGVELRLDCPPAVPLVSGDAGLLKQAILNLALNAFQATPAGGHVRIASAVARGHNVEFVVEDTGTGIAPEHLDRIFDLYFTTKERGTGIGLSMVFRTVQLHDGEVEVQSVPGHGTTFRLLLPQA